MKYNEKQRAIELRKAGLSYREILEQIPVAKSTLSKWLHSVGLSEYQKQRLTEIKRDAIRRGAEAKHTQRVVLTQMIIESAQKEIDSISPRELWLMGVMLYWAEGSKEKAYRSGGGVQFTNMDPTMICFFLHWLKEVCGIEKENLVFEIYIHETHRYRIEEIIDFWSRKIGIPREHFPRIYFKKANRRTNRKNVGASYFGVIRIRVKSSTLLNRKIAGWTAGVVNFFRK